MSGFKFKVQIQSNPNRNDFSVVQFLGAQLLAGSAALVSGSVLVSSSLRVGEFGSDSARFGSAGKVRTFGFGL